MIIHKPVLITNFEGKFIIDNKEACPLTINSAADETICASRDQDSIAFRTLMLHILIKGIIQVSHYPMCIQYALQVDAINAKAFVVVITDLRKQ